MDGSQPDHFLLDLASLDFRNRTPVSPFIKGGSPNRLLIWLGLDRQLNPSQRIGSMAENYLTLYYFVARILVISRIARSRRATARLSSRALATPVTARSQIADPSARLCFLVNL